LAEHILLKERVCLKIEGTQLPEMQALFREEARLLWNLSHESLPGVKDYLETTIGGDFIQCIVMSYVEGVNLQDEVDKHGFIDDEHICWIMQRILLALNYLHFHQVVHCDIKPANIIINKPVHLATLVDFGLSMARPEQFSRAHGGTEFFMPPEFPLGKPPIPQSDMYSLGMTAIFLAGGDIGSGNPPADMHPDLRSFFGRMVRRDPTARPGSAVELHQELSILRQKIFGRCSTQEEFKYRK
jgi:serine/threonine protein kinase